MTGERADGHLRQGTGHEPPFADLISPDEVQRDCGGHRKRGVQSIGLVLHQASLPAMPPTVSAGQVPGTNRSAGNRLSHPSTHPAPGADGDTGRIIGIIPGATLAIRLAGMAARGTVAALMTFVIIGMIAMAVSFAVWLAARHPHRS